MDNQVTVEISARHVHLSQADLETLFGKGYELTVKKMLSQPGQYASNERVRVVGTKSEFPAVSILGPVRKATQVELSLTDARSIGVTAPVRESGDIAGSGACKLVGPAGEVELTEGVIAAKRHIHATTADAERMGLENGQIVSVEIPSANGRNLTCGGLRAGAGRFGSRRLTRGAAGAVGGAGGCCTACAAAATAAAQDAGDEHGRRQKNS